MINVIHHALDYFTKNYNLPKTICILQPTSPFRNIEKLKEGFRLLVDRNCDSVVSIEKIPQHYSPYTAMKIEDGFLKFFHTEGTNITRRQEVNDVFIRSGCFYFLKSSTLINKNSLYGDRCLPIRVDNKNNVNLDTMDDWDEAVKKVSEDNI